MKPFEMLVVGLTLLLVVVSYLNYKEKKNMNDFIMGGSPKKPCSCTDHGQDLSDAPTSSTADDALAAAGL